MPLSEKALIRGLRGRAGRATRIGDDCAVLRIPSGHEALVTTDFSLEDVHFNRKWQPAESVGHRCLVRGLSDIAAMGGDPVAVFLSLGLPGKIPQKWVDGFLSGLLNLAHRFGVSLDGGDTARSPEKILADIVVLGSVPKGKAILRSGARAGDKIFVTGVLGAAAATLSKLMAGGRRRVSSDDFQNYFYPPPRIGVGRILRKKGIAAAMIDISDGLSTDLAHVCEESGVGAEVIADQIPQASQGGLVGLQFALHGGDAYELLFTAPQGKDVPGNIDGVAITEIGSILKKKGVWLRSKGKSRELSPGGWEHFRK